jgi:tetratricopeptide (TPR) repeat protein
LAFFGFKKDGNGSSDANGGTPGGGGPTGSGEGSPAFSPDNAKKFFDHARTVHETGNYEYAVQSWLSGMKLDPTSVDGLLGFFASLDKFLQETGGKKPVSKEVVKNIGGNNDLDKYLRAVLEWGQKASDAALAVRAFEGAVKMGVEEPAKWIGERALAWTLKQPKPRKELLIKVCDGLEKIGVFEKAIIAAEEAMKLDPSDGPLAARVRSLAARATMTKGGYDKAGPGGFRQNVRDSDKQRMLEESDRVVQTGESLDRLITAAEQELKSRPDDIPTREKFCRYLMQRGTPDDEELAHATLMEAYEATNQFRFRELAGDIRIKQARRRLAEAKRAAEEKLGDAERMTAFHAAIKGLKELEVEELQLRAEAYPTDIGKKYELGTAFFRAERFEEAIPLFQEAQGDPRFRGKAHLALAECFYRMQWIDEAIQTYRTAVDSRDLMPEQLMELQYGLMRALQAKAEGERDQPSAEEAEKIASGIAIKNLAYKDIRGRREALKRLVQALKKGGVPPVTPPQ